MVSAGSALDHDQGAGLTAQARDGAPKGFGIGERYAVHSK